MGIGIKNEVVEALVRGYAQCEGMGVTEAVAHAVRIARKRERRERTDALRKQMADRFLEIAAQGRSSAGQEWTRDELHECTMRGVGSSG